MTRHKRCATITAADLRILGACQDQTRRFADAFPEGLALSVENITKAQKADMSIYFLVGALGDSSLLDAYVAARKPAQDAYNAARKTAQDAYAATNAARDAYDAAIKPAWDAYDAATAPILFSALQSVWPRP